MKEFFGRDDLLDALKSLWDKRVASLVTCRGRRRIGKSTLIEEFARRSGARFLKLEGLRPKPKLSNADQLRFFISQLALQTECDRSDVSDWLEAFSRLDRQIGNRKTVVLLDEISWMGFYDPTFPEVLKVAWDNFFSRHPRLVLVACGSVSMWIRKNIVDNGAFAGRRSYDFVVPELPLKECVKFWGKRMTREDLGEVLDVLSVTGGVPKYLEEVKSVLSADENIRRMAFIPKSVLASDFEEMFRDVITGESGFRTEILRALVDAPLNVSELAAKLGKERNGHFSDALEELQEAGFIGVDEGVNPETGKDVQEMRYRLKDNYVRFYLRYIEPKLSIIERGGYAFTSLEQLPGWEAIKGLAFENLVINNFRELLPRLGLERSLVTSAAPFRKGREERGSGVQIDLLLQTNRSVYVIEVKRRAEIGHAVVDEVDEKIARIKRRRGISYKTALVYDGHLSKAVEADGYFDATIDIREVME